METWRHLPGSRDGGVSDSREPAAPGSLLTFSAFSESGLLPPHLQLGAKAG